jgi:hypothetical protein
MSHLSRLSYTCRHCYPEFRSAHLLHPTTTRDSVLDCPDRLRLFFDRGTDASAGSECAQQAVPDSHCDVRLAVARTGPTQTYNTLLVNDLEISVAQRARFEAGAG